MLEKFWYARGIGYSMGDTIEYTAEIVGYRVFDEEKRVWNEVLPEDPEQYR